MDRIARMNGESVCPICGQKYSGYPALSREDNNTLICPECGVRESLEAFGYSTADAVKAAKEIQEVAYEKGYTE